MYSRAMISPFGNWTDQMLNLKVDEKSTRDLFYGPGRG